MHLLLLSLSVSLNTPTPPQNCICKGLGNISNYLIAHFNLVPIISVVNTIKLAEVI